MINKKLLPYVEFVERDDIMTVWRIHVDETFALASKDLDYPDPDGIEEIQQKLNDLIDAIEKCRI